jgi:5-formyltetrahydrofolate cyclo-ligase
MNSKIAIRRHFKEMREHLHGPSMDEWSQQISNQLFMLLRQRCFDGVLYLFVPMRGEPDVLAGARRYQCPIALPIITGHGSMEFYHWVPGDRLKMGAFGIPTPEETLPVMIPKPGDALVMPALAIDGSGVRLGFGGGYYDRYLQEHRRAFSFVAGAVFPPFFSIAPLPSEVHDQPVDFCLTVS